MLDHDIIVTDTKLFNGRPNDKRRGNAEIATPTSAARIRRRCASEAILPPKVVYDGASSGKR